MLETGYSGCGVKVNGKKDKLTLEKAFESPDGVSEYSSTRS
jgi:hypothetical protein